MKRYFILAPREMSEKRIRDLLRKYLERGKVVFGVAKEEYVAGFEGQPQFKTLKGDLVKKLAEKSGGRLEVVEYAQKDGIETIKWTRFDRAVVVNGSFHRSFHLRPEYEAIAAKGAEVRYESPFVDEMEAKEFAEGFEGERGLSEFAEENMQRILGEEAKRAFITDFQTAAAIVKNGEIVALAHNEVVPYETYAWHWGLSREKHKTPAGDSSHYDAVHAETAALIGAGEKARGGTIYMKTFPCPHCARNIIYAGINEVVYELDYGDDYGYDLFEKAGVKTRRFDERG
jgi:deoxycytidylate deaminase